MENNNVNGAIMGAAASIMAASMLVMEDEAFRSQIPKAPWGKEILRESYSLIAFYIQEILIVSIKYI